MNTVVCKTLSKSYFRKKVLDELSFSIPEYTITGVVGRNGAGKTTLMKLIAGFLRPSAGELDVFGQKPFENLSVSAHSIFVDDQMSFSTALQLGEILEAGKLFYPNWNEELAQRLFAYFSFDAKGYHNRLSKGRTSTFNAILGIAARCPLTIFDEPTTGMDASVRKDFYRALLKDYIAFPRTILLSSHHLEEVEDILEHILLIDKGKVRLHMPMEDLQTYAVAVKGRKEAVQEWLYEKEIIFEREFDGRMTYAAVINDFPEFVLEKAAASGLETSFLPASDLCVMLTNQAITKGGIDDVFADSAFK